MRCGAEIEYANSFRLKSKMYCSAVCRASHYAEKNKEKVVAYKKKRHQQNSKEINEKKRIRYLNNKVPAKTVSCQMCGEDFIQSRVDRKFCSKRCGDKFSRKLQDTNKWFRDYYKNNLDRKLAACMRSRLNKALKGQSKSSSFKEYIGCSIEQLKLHLELQFQPNMSWDNYGKYGWHIDHIKPLSSFNLADPDELKKACHYTNLQPLWAKDNLSKGAKEVS